MTILELLLHIGSMAFLSYDRHALRLINSIALRSDLQGNPRKPPKVIRILSFLTQTKVYLMWKRVWHHWRRHVTDQTKVILSL
jgi:hypothetical protein